MERYCRVHDVKEMVRVVRVVDAIIREGGHGWKRDKIILKNMQFYGYHGVFSAEREMGERFEVDLELENGSHPGKQGR